MDDNQTKKDMGMVRYTYDMLFSDIQADLTENIKISKSDDRYKHECTSKLIVFRMLLDLAELYKPAESIDNEKLRNAINIIVDGDEQLSGYIFFVSQNPQFNYSWNYMRKCRTLYKDFLINSIQFLNNVLVDINLLAYKPISVIGIHVIFHDIIDVELTSKDPFVKARLNWENFYRLAAIKSEYNVIVKHNDTLLKACIRKNPSDMENLIDFVV
ncbi:hypothetical protein [Pseudobutyrivibrio sp.]|uniref:hypothetical protein n=1 Tax=Pseudobutyrivibrio sp. TaxID=2014367 RepID=UPI00386CB6AD